MDEVHNIVQKGRGLIQTIPKKKKCKKAKWLSEEALQIAEKRREAKDKRKDPPQHPSCVRLCVTSWAVA